MPDLERLEAGLRCREVLAILSDYVDADLPQTTVDMVNGHLRACDHCEKFGGEFGFLVAVLRKGLFAGERCRPDSLRRLKAHIHQEWANRVEKNGNRERGRE